MMPDLAVRKKGGGEAYSIFLLFCFMEFKRITGAERPQWRMVCFCLTYISSTD